MPVWAGGPVPVAATDVESVWERVVGARMLRRPDWVASPAVVRASCIAIWDLEPSIARARRNDHRSRRDLAAVGQHDHVEAFLDAQARDLARGVEMRAEAHRLDRGTR